MLKSWTNERIELPQGSVNFVSNSFTQSFHKYPPPFFQLVRLSYILQSVIIILPSVYIPARAVLPIKFWKSRAFTNFNPFRMLVTNKYFIGIFTPCASVDVHTTQETYLFFNACSTTSLTPFWRLDEWGKTPNSAAFV